MNDRGPRNSPPASPPLVTTGLATTWLALATTRLKPARRVMSPAGWAVFLGTVALGFSPVSAAVLAEGTLAQIGPQGIVVRTATGDVAVPLSRSSRLYVRAPAKLDDLPDGVPCLIGLGTIAPNSKELGGNLLVPVGPYRADPSTEHVMIDSAGKAEFQNVPGLLRKGPPLVFQVGPRVEHLLLTPQGMLVAAKNQKVYTNQSIPLAGAVPMIEYDFNGNLQMAGNNAKVRVIGTPGNLGGATIHVDRTEPFTPPKGKSK